MAQWANARIDENAGSLMDGAAQFVGYLSSNPIIGSVAIAVVLIASLLTHSYYIEHQNLVIIDQRPSIDENSDTDDSKSRGKRVYIYKQIEQEIKSLIEQNSNLQNKIIEYDGKASQEISISISKEHRNTSQSLRQDKKDNEARIDELRKQLQGDV